MSIKLIVAVDNNFGIGYKNHLLFKISEDLRRFKYLTTGNFVVMGRKTYESLPKALPNRTNVVLTKNRSFKPNEYDTVVEHDVKRIINHYSSGKQEKDLFVIGGEEIYKEFLPYADRVYLTFVNKKAENVDTYFPVAEMREIGFDLDGSQSFYEDSLDCEVTFANYVKRPKVT